MRGLRLSIRDRRADRGAAAVEFALVVFPLVVIAVGILSFGVMLSFRQNLSQAAAEGARAAAVTLVDANRQTSAYAAIDSALDASGVDCANGILKSDGVNAGTCGVVIAACEALVPTGPKCATVTLTYNYQDHGRSVDFPGLGVLLPDELVYTANARVS